MYNYSRFNDIDAGKKRGLDILQVYQSSNCGHVAKDLWRQF